MTEDNCLIAEPAEADAGAFIEHLKRVAAETDFIIPYADELITCVGTSDWVDSQAGYIKRAVFLFAAEKLVSTS